MVQSNKVYLPQEVLLVSTCLASRQINAIRLGLRIRLLPPANCIHPLWSLYILKTLSALLLVITILTTACAPKSEVDKAQAEAKELAAKVESLERQNNEQRTRISELETAVKQQSGKLAAAQQQLDRKPSMPVRVSLRKALLGGGYVAVFSTTVKQDFPILVTVRSKALGTSKQYRVNLSSTGTTEMGTSDGFNVDPDDELFLENTNFESATLTFKK